MMPHWAQQLSTLLTRTTSWTDSDHGQLHPAQQPHPAGGCGGQCIYCVNSDNSCWTELCWQAWVSSSLFGVSKSAQEFDPACFRIKVIKIVKSFEHILFKLYNETPSKILAETATETKEKGKEVGATEKGEDQAYKTATKQQPQKIVEPAQPSFPSPHCTCLLKINLQPSLLPVG